MTRPHVRRLQPRGRSIRPWPSGSRAPADGLRADAGGLPIPADAVTTSGSGLDPDVSPENARMQAARIARARGVAVPEVQGLIDSKTESAFLGFIGQPRVNVLAVDRALDASFPMAHPKT